MFETRETTLSVGGSVTIEAVGQVVTCLEADGPMRISFGQRGQGGRIEKGLQIPTNGFDQFRLDNLHTGANSVRLAISELGVRDSRFNLPGTLNVDVQNFPAVQAVTDAVEFGGSEYCANVTNATIVDPSANTHGLIIRSFSAGYGLGQGDLWANTVSPATGYSATPKGAVLFGFRGGGPTTFKGAFKVPAGKGVYWRANGAVLVSMNYDLLTG